jgi:ABC-type Zn uptake system ZnuABC Zn-binding protein ZnuA
MISEEEYNNAKKIIDIYEEQLRLAETKRIQLLELEQRKREEDCEEHEYRPDNHVWGSLRMKCCNCGKVIER